MNTVFCRTDNTYTNANFESSLPKSLEMMLIIGRHRTALDVTGQTALERNLPLLGKLQIVPLDERTVPNPVRPKFEHFPNLLIVVKFTAVQRHLEACRLSFAEEFAIVGELGSEGGPTQVHSLDEVRVGFGEIQDQIDILPGFFDPLGTVN